MGYSKMFRLWSFFTLYLTDANTAGDFFNISKISLPMQSIPIELQKKCL